jgi:hypothetical protein
MSRPLRLEFEGAFWHITSRGNERKDIFREDRDQLLFLSLLATAVKRFRWGQERVASGLCFSSTESRLYALYRAARPEHNGTDASPPLGLSYDSPVQFEKRQPARAA